VTLRGRLKKALGGRRGLIVLSDLDGTLAPIRDRPRDVRVPENSRRILARLARHPRARVGIVSGRELAQLKPLVRVPGAAYAGCHGLEVAWGRMRFRHPRAVALLPLLRRVTRSLRREAARFRGVVVEPKGLSVCLHYRLASPRDVPALRGIVREILASAPALELLAGRKVLELRPRVAWGKGEAVRLLRSLLAGSLRRRALTIYLGDDATDEEVFRALRGKAVCVAVGRRRTRAPYRLGGPAEVEKLLAWLAEALEGVDVRR
jgi:trehalose-phosphatase